MRALFAEPSGHIHCFLLTLQDSLEFELSGELVLGLLQFLSAPHVLVIHVLDLRFDALELGIQLRGEREREREKNREGEEENCRPAQCTH